VLNIPAAAIAPHMLLSHPPVGVSCFFTRCCTCPEIPEKWTKFLSSSHSKFLGDQGVCWHPCSSLTPQEGVSSRVLRLTSGSGKGDLAAAFFQRPNLHHKALCAGKESSFTSQEKQLTAIKNPVFSESPSF